LQLLETDLHEDSHPFSWGTKNGNTVQRTKLSKQSNTERRDHNSSGIKSIVKKQN